MTIQVDSIEPASGGLINMVSSKCISIWASGSVSGSGGVVLNLETQFGLGTTGWLLVRGNENGGNSSQRLYIWTCSSYSGGSRTAGLTLVGSTNVGNNYGNVFLGLPPYTTTSAIQTVTQTHSGTTSSVFDITLRNSQGAGCAYGLNFWRTG